MTLVILLRVVLSVSANAVQKRLLLDRAGVNQTWILTYAIMLPPAIGLALLTEIPAGPAFWQDIFIGGGLDALGNLAMVAALRSTDISVFGPLNAFRPIIALLFGWLFLRELPSAIGLSGVAITVLGAVILFSDKRPGAAQPPSAIWKPLVLRSAGLALGVFGAVFLKRAAEIGSPQATVAGWIASGLLVLIAFAAARQRGSLADLPVACKAHYPWLLLHSGVFLIMQLLTIFIFQKTLLAYAFVFFQMAIVLQVFVGRFVFREGAFRRRLAAALVMALGSALILWKG